jgi:hypothetical protein
MQDNGITLTLTIPSAIHDRLQKIVQQAGYENINDFLLFILQELFPVKVEEMDRIEQNLIEQRLRDLGYM